MELQTLFLLVGLLLSVSTNAAPSRKKGSCRAPAIVNNVSSHTHWRGMSTSSSAHKASSTHPEVIVNAIAEKSSKPKVTSSATTTSKATTSKATSKATTTSKAKATSTTTRKVTKSNTSTVKVTTTLKPTTKVTTTQKSAPTDTSSSSGQVGLCINSKSVDSFSSFTSGTKLSWYTNWATAPLSAVSGVEWVPQVWGENTVAGVKAAAASWPSGVKNVLSFNEPDMTSAVGGSAISADRAATLHQTWVKSLGGSYQIGAPAVARGSKAWLQSWIAACAGNCQYDFVPFHFYGTSAADLITYAKDFHTTFGKPLWVTEWACQDYSTGKVCTDAEVRAFMKTAVAWFRGDGAGIVKRWAWYGAFPDKASKGNANGLENTDGSANSMGTYYLSL